MKKVTKKIEIGNKPSHKELKNMDIDDIIHLEEWSDEK